MQNSFFVHPNFKNLFEMWAIHQSKPFILVVYECSKELMSIRERVEVEMVDIGYISFLAFRKPLLLHILFIFVAEIMAQKH